MPDTHVIDPQMLPAIERQNVRKASRIPMSEVPIAAIRERAREEFAALNTNAMSIPFVKNLTVQGAFGPVKARVYDALGERENAPGLIYFHGGGWIVGDLDSEDAKLRRLAHASATRIVSIDYALAPEHTFPQPLEDCIAATAHIHENAKKYGLDPRRLAIGGASAGANLALSTAISLRDQAASWLRHLILFYGIYDIDGQPPSRILFAENFGLGADAMEFFYSMYLNRNSQRSDPRASPLHANLSGLPPAYINAAALDVLRDDSRALATKLRACGSSVSFSETAGVIHGYTLYGHEVAAARSSIAAAGHALRTVFG